MTETRSRILSAALLRFAQSDYTSTSLKDIAADVGIKAPSIYAHFTSKEELYAEVYTRSIGDHQDFFNARIDDAAALEPIERLHQLFTGVREFYRSRPELLEFHLSTALGHNRAKAPGMADTFQVWDADLSAAVREAYLEGVARGQFTSLSPEAFTSHFMCLLDGLFLQMGHYPSALYDAHLTQTWDVLVQFLTAHTSQESS
ncbi:TetR/AcrR family transcriptional regulator [Leucobacter sp. cx-42]|uniref:TetR/AcrR family transcriptional regulator n=1 Tax=unclassified Leucobacter TaxID=2621730 RepID=UPI00165EB2FF|nr:TetR/AcrR family transcriptional regulator [Leucobacter sp. cx-42]